MIRKPKKNVVSKVLPFLDTDESVPFYDGADNSYSVEPRLDKTDRTVISAVEAIPFVGRAISDLFFGETKRNEKLDQIAAQKVTIRRDELDRLSPRAAFDLGDKFYDNAFARERNEIKNVR